MGKYTQDAAKLLELAAKPLANPPFPLEHLDRMMAAMQEQNQE